MANNLEARRVQVEVKIGDVVVPVNSITLTHAIGELPYVEFSVQLDNKTNKTQDVFDIGSVKIDLAKFNKLGRTIQEKILNNFEMDPDVQISILDGENQILTFNGFLGKPQTRLTDGQLLIGFSAVHKMAVLQAFNAQIYSNQHFYSMPGSSSENSDQLPEAPIARAEQIKKTASITRKLQIILDELLDNYAGQRNIVDGEFTAAPIHNLNLAAYKHVQKFLSDSQDWTIIEGLDDPDYLSYNLHSGLYYTLVDSHNFFQSLAAFARMFIFQMNADWSGRLWLEKLQTLEETEERKIVIPIQSLSASTAAMFEIPVAQVLIQAPGSDFWALYGNQGIKQGDAPVQDPTDIDLGAQIVEAKNSGFSSLKTMAAYPSKIPADTIGTYYIKQAPSWIASDQFTTADVKDLIDPAKPDKFNAASAIGKKLSARLKKQDAARKHILDYLAEQTFRDLYLRNTSATVGLPLNVAIRPGRTYDVYSVTGERIFSGYLNVVQHLVTLTVEGIGTAQTQLEFSHVLADGVELKPVILKNGTTDTLIDSSPSAITENLGLA